MGTKIIIKIVLFIVLISLWGCPSIDPCPTADGYDKSIPDLITISPLQESYSAGDEIVIAMVLESEQSFVNETITVDLFDKTKIENEPLQNNELYKIIERNNFQVLKGNIENNNPVLVYSADENKYSFSIKITLNSTGNYLLHAYAVIVFQDRQGGDCFEYVLHTNIEGINEDQNIEFTVE